MMGFILQQKKYIYLYFKESIFMIKIGIVLREMTQIGKANNDLQQLLVYQKFASEITIALSREQNIMVHIIKKNLIENIVNTVEQDKFDILIAFECTSDYVIDKGIKTRHNSSSIARKSAEIFQSMLIKNTGLKDLGIIQKGGKVDREGIVLDKLASLSIPCVIANPFSTQDSKELQQLMHNYKNILNAYISAIKKTAELF